MTAFICVCMFVSASLSQQGGSSHWLKLWDVADKSPNNWERLKRRGLREGTCAAMQMRKKKNYSRVETSVFPPCTCCIATHLSFESFSFPSVGSAPACDGSPALRSAMRNILCINHCYHSVSTFMYTLKFIWRVQLHCTPSLFFIQIKWSKVCGQSLNKSRYTAVFSSGSTLHMILYLGWSHSGFSEVGW